MASLADHKPFFTGKVSEQLLDSYLSHQSRSDGLLSPRERVIVQLIAEGNSNKDMGEALGLSVKTIESHRASLMRKLKLQIDGGDRSLCDTQSPRRAVRLTTRDGDASGTPVRRSTR